MRRRSGMGQECGFGDVGAFGIVPMTADKMLCRALLSDFGGCCICVLGHVCELPPALDLALDRG